MRQAWNRLGSPDAISWVLVLLVFIQQASGSLVAPFTDIHGRVFEFLAVRIASLLVAFAVLGLGKLALMRFARQRPLPLVTLTTFVLTGVAGTVTQNWLLIVTGFTNQWTIPQRLLLSIPGVFTILILSGILISMARELARRNQELSETADQLLATRTDAVTRIEQRKADLVNMIEVQLEQSLVRMQTNSRIEIADGLKSLVDDVIRPLSFQLSSEVATFQPPEIIVSNPRISWRVLVTHAMTTNPAHAITSSIWLGALVGVFLSPSLGVRGLLTAVAVSIITLAGLALMRFSWRFIPPRMPVYARASIFGVFIAGLMAVGTPAMESVSGYGFTTLIAFIGWIVLSSFITWTVTLFFAVRDSLQATRATLLATVDELKREVVQLNSEMRLLQKGISRVLHGPVQEIVSASIYRLKTSDPEASSEASVIRMNERIASTIQMLNNPPESTIDLDVAIRDLVELWDEVVEISIDLPVETRERLNQDANATNVVMELIRETCGNAIRHGEAKHINVSGHIDQAEDTFDLIIENDGKRLPASSRTGLGSQIFDELCLTWSRAQVGSLVRLEARIPLAR